MVSIAWTVLVDVRPRACTRSRAWLERRYGREAGLNEETVTREGEVGAGDEIKVIARDPNAAPVENHSRRDTVMKS